MGNKQPFLAHSERPRGLDAREFDNGRYHLQHSLWVLGSLYVLS